MQEPAALGRLDAIVVPKVEDPEHLVFVSEYVQCFFLCCFFGFGGKHVGALCWGICVAGRVIVRLMSYAIGKVFLFFICCFAFASLLSFPFFLSSFPSFYLTVSVPFFSVSFL